MCGGILFCVLFVFILFGLLIAILPLTGVNVEMLHLVYCGIGVLIFSIYLIYDTQVQLCDLATDFYLKKIRTYLPWYTMFTPQMMMGGNHKYSISPEEYIFAAIAIYLDILNIFLYILRIVGAAKK